MLSTSEIASQCGVSPGQLLAGKYRIESVIGEGGMGIVLAATHVDLDCKVAIKLVRVELAKQEEVVERMLLEARAAAKIRSEHVARVLDVGRVDSGAPFIVMEFLEGSDLRSVLEQQILLEPQLAVDLILQACEAIAEAHVAGIVHRDLKPENLFLSARSDGTPVVKVLDFGISKQLNPPTDKVSWTNPSTAVGSPHYMAPEQMRRADDVDARADIWALGAILYELLTRVSPFDAETIPAVCARVIGDDPAPLRELAPDLPAGLEAAVARCLAKPLDQRFASVSELASALAPFGSELSTLYAERVARVGLGPALPGPYTRISGLPSPIPPASLAPSVISRPLPITLVTLAPTRRRRRISRALGWVAGAMTLTVGAWLLGSPLPLFGKSNETPVLSQSLATPAAASSSTSSSTPVSTPVPSVAVVPSRSLLRGPGLPSPATARAPRPFTPRARAPIAFRMPAPSVSHAEPPAPERTDAPRRDEAARRIDRDAWDPDNFGGRR